MGKRKARKRYKSFHRRDPDQVLEVELPDPGDTLVDLGPCVAIEYESDKEGDGTHTYRHVFESDQVRAYTNPDGAIILIAGGDLEVDDWIHG